MAGFKKAEGADGADGRHFAPKQGGAAGGSRQSGGQPGGKRFASQAHPAQVGGTRFARQQPDQRQGQPNQGFQPGRASQHGRAGQVGQAGQTSWAGLPGAGRAHQQGQRGNAAPSGQVGQIPYATQAMPVRESISAAGQAHRPQGALPAAGIQSASPYAQPSRKGKKGKKKRGARDVISLVLIIIGLILLLVAGGIFIRAQIGYRQAAEKYKELEQYAVVDEAGDGIPQVDFASLQAINDDVIGWIYVPGTAINYPVLQGETNETYLRHLLDGTWNDNGSIFMDMDGTRPGMVDQQTTLYGHHMNDNSMFKQIDDTLDQEAFDKIKAVYYITPEATYTCTPLFTTQVQDTYTDARVTNFTGDTTLADYLHDAYSQAKAVAEGAEERLDSTDKVLTLVTCAGEIIPRTTRAAMVCAVEEVTPRV